MERLEELKYIMRGVKKEIAVDASLLSQSSPDTNSIHLMSLKENIERLEKLEEEFEHVKSIKG